jgi:hypothetical protein
MSISIETAIEKVVAYWSLPVGTELTEATRFCKIKDTILTGVSWTTWRTLYNRLLALRFEAGESRATLPAHALDEKPILLLLWGVIDRRPRLGIAPPTPTARQQYPARVEEQRRWKVGRFTDAA